VWAVGEPNLIAHYDGHSWSLAASAPMSAFRSVWGSSPKDVWAGTRNDYSDLWHYDGTTWSPVDKGFDGTVVRGWTSPQGNIWLSGLGGTVFVRR
jgi:hypothetical protein